MHSHAGAWERWGANSGVTLGRNAHRRTILVPPDVRATYWIDGEAHKIRHSPNLAQPLHISRQARPINGDPRPGQS
ncbi:hypothetical protein D3C81_2250770 [compost metagenome]